MKFLYFLTESPAEVKKLKADANSVNSDKSQKEIYNELISMLTGKSYSDSVEFIDEIVKDEKLKFILSLGFGGKFSNTKLKLEKKNISVKRLIPLQNEIGFEETLKFIKEGKNVEKCYEDPVMIKHPIVTFQGNFIIDGHHRWSEIYVTNREAFVECVNIDGNLSPIEILKAVQATIGSNTGDLKLKSTKGENLLKSSEKKIRDYLSDISESAQEKIAKFAHIKKTDVIDFLVKNAIALKVNNSPILNAPSRGEMPQTSKDPDLFSDLKKGTTKVA